MHMIWLLTCISLPLVFFPTFFYFFNLITNKVDKDSVKLVLDAAKNKAENETLSMFDSL